MIFAACFHPRVNGVEIDPFGVDFIRCLGRFTCQSPKFKSHGAWRWCIPNSYPYINYFLSELRYL